MSDPLRFCSVILDADPKIYNRYIIPSEINHTLKADLSSTRETGLNGRQVTLLIQLRV